MSTYTPIASITLASAASEVTFSGIPQNYTDLVVVIGGSQSVATNVNMRLNGDTGNNYSDTQMNGNGSVASSGRNSNQPYFWFGVMGTDQSTALFHIMNYANTTTNKTVLQRSNAPTFVQASVGLYRSTNAITSVTVFPITGNFASGSTFNLYGIANASITNVAKATGGDIVTTDGTYWYHAFLSSGTFTPTQSITADCLVIAGGGSGGHTNGAGGGAGGLLAHTSQSLTAQNYTITIGGGGARAGSAGRGTNGSNSQFGSLTASVGGGAGGGNGLTGNNGGSGGGGGGGANGGTATSGQGNNGGFNQGGGGGATAAGNVGTSNGFGGAGSSAYSSWGSATGTGENVSGTYWFAGGGAAFSGSTSVVSGGNGGGGDSGTSGSLGQSALDGISNTGGGGGGWNGVASESGRGGSGIVIVRYGI